MSSPEALINELRRQKDEALTERDAALDRAKSLAEAIDFAMHEIGVPNDGYPANIANAYDRLFDAAEKDLSPK